VRRAEVAWRGVYSTSAFWSLGEAGVCAEACRIARIGRAASVRGLAAEPLDCAVRVIRDSMVVVDVGCVWAGPVITSGGLSALTSFVSGNNILLILIPALSEPHSIWYSQAHIQQVCTHVQGFIHELKQDRVDILQSP